MSRFPTPDLPQRLLNNGGRVPSGLFRPNYYRGDRRRGPGTADDPIARLVQEFRDMLRDLTNLNVRQPSHMAPPFRGQQWLYQFMVNGGSVTPVVVPINGNQTVPNGSLCVLSWIAFNLTTTFNSPGTTVPAWGETGVSPITISILKNGNALPGLNALRPSYTVGAQQDSAPDFQIETTTLPNPPIVPVTLIAGDELSWRGAAGNGDFYVQMSGWLYPVEVDADGIRGTLADRGT